MSTDKERRAGYVGIDIGTRYTKIECSYPIVHRLEELVDYSASPQEQTSQKKYHGATPERLYLPSRALLLKDQELIQRENGRTVLVGYEAQLKGLAVKGRPELGRGGFVLENGTITDGELFKSFLTYIIQELFDKQIDHFDLMYADSPAEHAAQQTAAERGGVTQQVTILKAIFNELGGRIRHRGLVGQVSAAAYSVDKGSEERTAYAMGLDMGGGQTALQALPIGKLTEMGPCVIVKDRAGQRFAGSTLARNLKNELNNNRYKVDGRDVSIPFSEADAERILAHGFGSVAKEAPEELKTWPVHLGARTVKVDISKPVTHVCQQIIDPIIEGIDELCDQTQKYYGGDVFGQHELSQMLSTFYLYGQNSNINGLSQELGRRLSERGVECRIVDIKDKRFGAADGAKALAQFFTANKLWKDGK